MVLGEGVRKILAGLAAVSLPCAFAVMMDHKPDVVSQMAWDWRYGIAALSSIFLLPWAFYETHQLGFRRGVTSVPQAPPVVDPQAQQRSDVSHSYVSVDAMQFVVRDICDHILLPDHVNAYKAAEDVKTIKRKHRLWYPEGAHLARNQFIGVIDGILRVRRNNGRQGLFGDVNSGELDSWDMKLVSVRGNLISALEEQREQ